MAEQDNPKPDVVEVRIDFNVNDSSAAVRALIERLDPVMQSGWSNTVHLDLRKSGYLGPDAIAVLCGVIWKSRLRKQKVVVTLPEGPKELRTFCQLSGLGHVINPDSPPPAVDRMADTIPVTVFRVATVTAHLPLLRLIERHVQVSDDFRERLGICISEVMQNVQDHSRSEIGGVLSARYFVNKRQVRVAVVDYGLGIRHTLAQAYPDTTSSVLALQRVLMGEYSARSRPNNMGLGLSNLAAMVNDMGGHAFIVTGDGLARIISGQARSFDSLRINFPGTGVFFTLPAE